MYVIVCMGMASGLGQAPVGRYLKTYDPDFRPSRAERRKMGAPSYQTGYADWTEDLDEAMTFDTAAQAHECWRAQSTVVPRRPDGKENRPLTAYNVEVVDLEVARRG